MSLSATRLQDDDRPPSSPSRAAMDGEQWRHHAQQSFLNFDEPQTPQTPSFAPSSSMHSGSNNNNTNINNKKDSTRGGPSTLDLASSSSSSNSSSLYRLAYNEGPSQRLAEITAPSSSIPHRTTHRDEYPVAGSHSTGSDAYQGPFRQRNKGPSASTSAWSSHSKWSSSDDHQIQSTSSLGDETLSSDAQYTTGPNDSFVDSFIRAPKNSRGTRLGKQMGQSAARPANQTAGGSSSSTSLPMSANSSTSTNSSTDESAQQQLHKWQDLQKELALSPSSSAADHDSQPPLHPYITAPLSFTSRRQQQPQTTANQPSAASAEPLSGSGSGSGLESALGLASGSGSASASASASGSGSGSLGTALGIRPTSPQATINGSGQSPSAASTPTSNSAVRQSRLSRLMYNRSDSPSFVGGPVSHIDDWTRAHNLSRPSLTSLSSAYSRGEANDSSIKSPPSTGADHSPRQSNGPDLDERHAPGTSGSRIDAGSPNGDSSRGSSSIVVANRPSRGGPGSASASGSQPVTPRELILPSLNAGLRVDRERPGEPRRATSAAHLQNAREDLQIGGSQSTRSRDTRTPTHEDSAGQRRDRSASGSRSQSRLGESRQSDGRPDVLTDIEIVTLGAIDGQDPTELLPQGGASLTSKNVLTIALAKAQSAVTFDSSNNVPEAIHSYGQAVRLLSEVMERIAPRQSSRKRTTREEERRRLKVIHDTYADRIRLLSMIYGPSEQERNERERNTSAASSNSQIPHREEAQIPHREEDAVTAPSEKDVAGDMDSTEVASVGQSNGSRNVVAPPTATDVATDTAEDGSNQVLASTTSTERESKDHEDKSRQMSRSSDSEEVLTDKYSDGKADSESQHQRSDSEASFQSLASMGTGMTSQLPSLASRSEALEGLPKVEVTQPPLQARTNRPRNELTVEVNGSPPLDTNARDWHVPATPYFDAQPSMTPTRPQGNSQQQQQQGSSKDTSYDGDLTLDTPTKVRSAIDLALQSRVEGKVDEAKKDVEPTNDISVSISPEDPPSTFVDTVKHSSGPGFLSADIMPETTASASHKPSSRGHSPRPRASTVSASSSRSATPVLPREDKQSASGSNRSAGMRRMASQDGMQKVNTELSGMGAADAVIHRARSTARGQFAAPEESASSSTDASSRRRALSQPGGKRPPIPAQLLGQAGPKIPLMPRMTRKISLPGLNVVNASHGSAAQGVTEGGINSAASSTADLNFPRSATAAPGQRPFRFPSPSPSFSSGYHALVDDSGLAPASDHGLSGTLSMSSPLNQQSLFPSGLSSTQVVGLASFQISKVDDSARLRQALPFLPSWDTAVTAAPSGTASMHPLLRPFTQVRSLSRSMSSRAFLTQKLCVSSPIWVQFSSKLGGLETKVRLLELVSSGIEGLEKAGVHLLSPQRSQPGLAAVQTAGFAKQLEDFDSLLIDVQNTFAKKLGIVDTFAGRKGSSLGNFGSKLTRSLDRMTTNSGSGSSGKNMDLPTAYVDVLGRLFARAELLCTHLSTLLQSQRPNGGNIGLTKTDSEAVEAYAGLSPEVRKVIEQKLIRSSEFFSNVIIKITLKDLNILLDKSLKRTTALISDPSTVS
ncbi:unnamed protein product [Sympodiomycopsis kandeliae]